MRTQVKTIVVSLFILLGAVMFCYGAFFNSRVISIPDKQKSIEKVKSEPALIQLASIGGIKLDEMGNINQLFGEGEKPPKKCAT
jgi:hypothetical protein